MKTLRQCICAILHSDLKRCREECIESIRLVFSEEDEGGEYGLLAEQMVTSAVNQMVVVIGDMLSLKDRPKSCLADLVHQVWHVQQFLPSTFQRMYKVACARQLHGRERLS